MSRHDIHVVLLETPMHATYGWTHASVSLRKEDASLSIQFKLSSSNDLYHTYTFSSLNSIQALILPAFYT